MCTALLVACSSKQPPAVIPQSTASCRDLACLEANQGNVIDAEGVFAFPTDPKRKGKHHYRVILADGTSIILPHPKENEAMRAKLSRDHDGKRVTARGKIYTKIIPDQYGIIARTSDPYCVELFDVIVAP